MIAYFGNRLKPLFVGCIIIAIGSFSFLFMGSSFMWLVLISVPIQGIGLAILLNTATSIISDVIGSDDSSSAFVYGVYSLFDKFSSGFCLYFMTQYLLEEPIPLRLIAGALPMGAGFGAFILCYIGQKLYANRLRALSVGVRQRK